MLRTGESKKRAETVEGERTRSREVVASPDSLLITPERAGTDEVESVLDETEFSVRRAGLRRVLRPLRWTLLLVTLFAFAAPAYLWYEHRMGFVTSKNAAVRAHLADIGARLSGQVAEVRVDVGDRVRAGQVLVELEDRHLRAEVEKSRADVAVLERTLEAEQVVIGLERRENEHRKIDGAAQLTASEARAKAVKLEADDAHHNYTFKEALFEKDGLVSVEVVRAAEDRWRTAEARGEEARADAIVSAKSVDRELRLAETSLRVRETNLMVLEAQLLGARARLSRAEADLQSAAVRAPRDGAVVRRIVQPGGSVEVGQPIISIWLEESSWVEAWIDEEDLGFVSTGSEATVTFPSLPGQEFAGVVDRIGLATDFEIPEAEVPQPRFKRMRGTPVVGVRILLRTPPSNLVPGLSAVVSIARERTDSTKE
ncbi:MAG: HlyD family secretion protein [Planctomycetota bacterium]